MRGILKIFSEYLRLFQRLQALKKKNGIDEAFLKDLKRNGGFFQYCEVF
jgi:hypothetical protein